MTRLIRKQHGLGLSQSKGFTIIELLVVILVVAILAGIVLFTFNGVQKKTRDADRRADISEIANQVQLYFVQDDNAKYPTLQQVNDDNFRKDNLKELSADEITAPGGEKGLVSEVAADTYYYAVTTDDDKPCDNNETDCTKFTLEAKLEGGGTFAKTGSGN